LRYCRSTKRSAAGRGALSAPVMPSNSITLRHRACQSRLAAASPGRVVERARRPGDVRRCRWSRRGWSTSSDSRSRMNDRHRRRLGKRLPSLLAATAARGDDVELQHQDHPAVAVW
jgi:hypothetical protein